MRYFAPLTAAAALDIVAQTILICHYFFNHIIHILLGYMAPLPIYGVNMLLVYLHIDIQTLRLCIRPIKFTQNQK